MAEPEIKQELDEAIERICPTCLSTGRRLVPLGEYSEIYLKITSDNECKNSIGEQLLICWECCTLLHKVLQFKHKVNKANEIMLHGQSCIHGTLSSLTTIVLDDKHPHTIYEDIKSNIEAKSEITENLDFIDESEVYGDDGIENDDNLTPKLNIHLITEFKKEDNKATVKKKPINRWAKKRALQNKKPKFKMVTNLDLNETIFRKVHTTLEELRKSMEIERDSEYYKSTKYKCDKCTLGFEKDSLLEKHIKKYHRKHKNFFTCDVCTKTYTNKRHLATHINNHYYKYTCTLCDYTCYNKRRRAEHVGRHTKVFQCLKCHLMFGCRREFFKHFKDWHEKFICDYCGVSFKMKYCIKDHIRKKHSPFECIPCGKRFARYNGLWLHNKTRHGGPAAEAYCVECDKVYPDVYRYRWHLANSARHKPKKPVRVPCPGCDKVFTKNIYMKDHYNLVHLKFFKYRCEECDKNFIRNADLVKHKRRVHEGILPPKNKICYICGRGFTTNKILRNHVRTHTGERPHVCARCPARFAQPTALHAHVRALHSDNLY